MKEKTYYLVLILLILTSFAIGRIYELHYKYWMGSIAAVVLYVWCKDAFTGKRWFEKPKPETRTVNTQLATMTSDEYEQYVRETYPPISEEEKSGYISLAKLCLAPDKQPELIAFFEDLKNYSQDRDYMTTLNYVMEHSDNHDLFFIMALDWKQDIETLEWRLENSLKKNFDLSVDLPNADKYGNQTSVSFDNIFEDYDQPLRSQSLQMGFIDTQSDEYVIFVHQIADKPKVEAAVNKIGYKYFEKTGYR